MPRVDSTMLVVGTVPQYFLDNVVIDQVQDLTRTVHAPRKEPGPLVAKDRSWENIPYLTVTGWSVVRDAATDRFLCWYEDWQFDPAQDAKCEKTFQSPVHSRLCLATSADGLHWEKPAFDYQLHDGQRTNVVFGGDSERKSEVHHVFLDPLEPDGERRFKLMYERQTPDGHMFSVAHSPDGVQWTRMKGEPCFGEYGGRLGDGFIAFCDEDARVYRMTCRHSATQKIHHDPRRPQTTSLFFPPTYPGEPLRANKRRVFQAVSRDLMRWSAPQCIIAPDEDEENLDETFYGMPQMKLGPYYLGFLNTLHEVSNTMNVRLAYSRDGWTWRHLNQRQPWLTTTPDAWDRYMVNMSVAPIPVGDDLYVFHGGAGNHHDYWINGRRDGLAVPEADDVDLVRYGLGLARLRRGGFVSLDAGPVRDGILVTRMLHTDAHELVINAACADGGAIEVEVTDPDENVIDGCARDQCDAFTGDQIDAPITWRGRAGIEHAGSVRLRFFSRSASLYAFGFK